MSDALQPRPRTSAGVVTLATIAVVGVLYVGHEVLVPIALALLLSALLHPVVGWLHARARLPAPAGAAIAVLASALLVVGIGAALAPPLRGLAADVPKSVAAARARLARLPGPLGTSFERLAGGPAASGPRPAPPAAPRAGRTPSDTTAPPPAGAAGAGGGGGDGLSSGLGRIAARAFGTTSSLLATAVEVLLLTLFVLAAGDAWRRRLDGAVASPATRARVTDAVREMRVAVARYVVATAAINLGQGVLVAGVAWLLHLPSPPLWGALTFVAEFIPYLGGAALMVLLLVVGLAAGGGARALVMPLAYLVITSLQNNLVSPIVYGRGLRLAPVAILVAVMVWWTLWGVAGAFLAVPILAALRILAEHVDGLRPLGAFLGE